MSSVSAAQPLSVLPISSPEEKDNVILMPTRASPVDRRVSSTTSPLADPQTPIHSLAVKLQSLLYFPDVSTLYVVCGTIIANTLRGYPVWLMLVGPPESGKTELLKPLVALDSVKECGDIAGKGALLSGTSIASRSSNATGGLLNSFDKNRGMLIMFDFARTVLAGDPRETRMILGALGMLHDQHYKRELGVDGGCSLSFDGKLGYIAACTDVIDHPDNHQANAEMGDRCLYYRYRESEGFHEIGKALDLPDATSKSAEIQNAFLEWAALQDLCWEREELPRPLDQEERDSIRVMAQFSARARSGVFRDRFSKEIQGISRAALGPRLANSLAQLLRGTERIGCTREESWRVLSHVTMDSIPQVRVEVLDVLRRGPLPAETIAGLARLNAALTRRTLEDLEIHETVERVGASCWNLTAKARAWMERFWIDKTNEKCG